MIGDPLILVQGDYKRAENIFKNIEDKRIILIGGSSGCRKSEQAYCLQKLFNDNKKSSFVVSLDDYYNTMPSIRVINRKKMGLESVGLSEIDWDYLQRIYEDFQNEKPITFRRTHRFVDAVEHNVLESVIDILIIEGLYANYLRKFYSDNFSIFLEGNPKQTLKFRKIRGKENEDDDFRQKVVQREFNVVCQLKKYADLIVPFGE
jgi:uridine kinase